MYAIISTGGKQYRVMPGQSLRVEKLPGDIGDTVSFDHILLLSKPGDSEDILKTGAPRLEGVTVTGEIVDQGRGEKVRIIKFKRRKHSMKRMGHRQSYTEVKITDITES